MLLMANKAAPVPPISSILGQQRVNILEFCKKFNDRTRKYNKNMTYPVRIIVNKNRKFKFVIKTPSISELIKFFTGISKFSSCSGKNFVGYITWQEISRISRIKKIHLVKSKVSSIKRMVLGTIGSMGIYLKK